MNASDWLFGIVVIGFAGLFAWARYCDDRDDAIDQREVARLKSWVWLILGAIVGSIWCGLRIYQSIFRNG